MPHIQQAYSKHSDSVTVEFSEVAGATSYILRAESLDSSFFSEMVVSGSPGTVVQLQPYTSYRLSVMSVNSGGQSQPSHSIQASTGNILEPKCVSRAKYINRLKKKKKKSVMLNVHFHLHTAALQKPLTPPA